MKTKLIPAFLLVAGLLAVGARAQTPAPAADPVALPAPSRVIYAPRLPSATELTNVAAAQGLGVERIDQTATQITVTYKAANGLLNTVAYQLLPSATTSGQTQATLSPVAVPASPAPVVMYTQPAPVVVYTQPAPTVVYTDPYPSYYYATGPSYYANSPWDFYGPLAVGIGLGIGFHGGYHDDYHGDYHDGYRHGGGFRHGHGR
jgi:hypothetical protein